MLEVVEQYCYGQSVSDIGEIYYRLPVSAIVLTANREKEAHDTIARLKSCIPPMEEIILVVNKTNDNTVLTVSMKWPDVHIVVNHQNRGIAGWNDGARIARTNCLLLLDDDCYPDTTAVERAHAALTRNPDIGLVSFRVYESVDGILMTEAYERWSGSFYGCACLIRRDVFLSLNGFLDRLFLYAHEFEFSLRLRDAGYLLHHEVTAIAYHRVDNSSAIDRGRLKRRVQYDVKNYVMILVLRFPLRRVFIRCIKIIIGRFLFSIVRRTLPSFLMGMVGLICELPWLLINRRVVAPHIQQEYRYGSCVGGVFFQEDVYGISRSDLRPGRILSSGKG